MKRLQFDDLPEDVRQSLEMMRIPGQDPDECLATLRRITGHYPGFVPARLNLAAMQLQAGDGMAAESTYQAVLSEFPGENGAIGGLATVAAANKDYARAELLARKALDNGYDWPPLYAVIGEARVAAGDTQAASAAYLQSYRLSPHSWKDLEHYCRLNNRKFLSPMDDVPQPIADDQLNALFSYIDEAAHSPDAKGDLPGCDHTFRFTEQWAKENAVDIIDLYQFLNVHGGFCDCEVCYNVESSLNDRQNDDGDSIP